MNQRVRQGATAKKPKYTKFDWVQVRGEFFKQFDMDCPACGKKMELKPSKFQNPVYYSCPSYPECKITHGAHPDGEPLGFPTADPELLQARIDAHRIFDGLWKSQLMSRRDAYSWMRRVLKMSRDDAHIAKFDLEECRKLISEVEGFVAAIAQ